MSGRPRRRAMIATLNERTRAAFPDEPEATALDYVALWTASGKTLNRLAEELSTSYRESDPDATENDGLPISGEMISRWLDSEFGAETAQERLTRARARGSYRMVDESLDIADSVTCKDDVPAAQLRVKARQWTAEKWNPGELGQARGVNVTMNFAQLHLDALRHFGNRVTGASENTLPAPNNSPGQVQPSGQVVVIPLLPHSDG